MVVDFKKNALPAPITLCDSQVDTVESSRFLGTSSGSWTPAPSQRKPSRGCSFCSSWRNSTCQRLWWSTSTCPSSSPSSPPPSPSGTLLPRLRTGASCSGRRWLAAISHPFREGYGWPLPPWIQTLWNIHLWQEAIQFLSMCSRCHQHGPWPPLTPRDTCHLFTLCTLLICSHFIFCFACKHLFFFNS